MLPRLQPYPDETLGSVFIRLHRHTGLPFPLLKRAVGIPELNHVGLLQARWLQQFSGITHLEPEQLATRHTMLPYSTSTSSDAYSAEVIRRAIDGLDTLKDVGRLANAVESQTHYRFCEGCIAEDHRMLGETYWRRVHQLPGVYCCPWHLCPLIGVSSRPFRRHVPDLMPDSVWANALHYPSWKQQILIGALSAHALAGKKLLYTKLLDAAMAGNFVQSNGSLSSQLQAELNALYDKEFLIVSKMTSNSLEHWIQGCLRPRANARIVPLRHILLRTLFDYSESTNLEKSPLERIARQLSFF